MIPFFILKNPQIFVTSVSLNGIPSIQMKRVFRRGKSFQLTRKKKQQQQKIFFIIFQLYFWGVFVYFLCAGFFFIPTETSCRNIWAIGLWRNIRLYGISYFCCMLQYTIVYVVDRLLLAVFLSYGTFVSFLVFLLFVVYEHWKFIGTGLK